MADMTLQNHDLAIRMAELARVTALRKVDITGLTGGETAKVTCSGKGCPFKSKTYKNLKKGSAAAGNPAAANAYAGTGSAAPSFRARRDGRRHRSGEPRNP